MNPKMHVMFRSNKDTIDKMPPELQAHDERVAMFLYGTLKEEGVISLDTPEEISAFITSNLHTILRLGMMLEARGVEVPSDPPVPPVITSGAKH